MTAVRTVRVNGRDEEVAAGTTVLALLEAHGLRREWVVVERNGDALVRSSYEHVTLEDGDRLEIVRAVAGGSR